MEPLPEKPHASLAENCPSDPQAFCSVYMQYLRNDCLVLAPSLLNSTEIFRGANSSVGSKAADFKIVKEIGRGASAIVYKVESLKDKHTYAMKVIGIGHFRPQQQKEALLEVLVLKNVQHPGIIRFFSSFVESNQLFIVTEYAEQGDLHSVIEKQKKKKMYVAEKEVWRLLGQLALAMLHLHVNNIIHRDIKPLNIFLTKEKVLKVFSAQTKGGSWGTWESRSSWTRRSFPRGAVIHAHLNPLVDKVVGTPLYLSPEVLKAQPYDQRVDVWAVGCTLYELLTLEPPFNGQDLASLSNAILNKTPAPIPAYSRFSRN